MKKFKLHLTINHRNTKQKTGEKIFDHVFFFRCLIRVIKRYLINLYDFKTHLEKKGYEDSAIEPILQYITANNRTDHLNRPKL